MTRTLYLHIGMHKTGSTAIQKAFDGYDDGTTAYLRLSKRNHSFGMASIFRAEKAAEQVAAGWAKSVTELRTKAAIDRKLLEEQVASGSRNLIISAEELSSKWAVHEVDRVRDALAHAFDRVQVIAYLRGPRSFQRSALQQIIKKRAVKLTAGPVPDYCRRFQAWEKVFGRDAMTYVLFASYTLAGQNVVADFAARVGIDPGLVSSRRANESMSAEAFAAIYRMRNYPGIRRWTWPASRAEAVCKRYQAFGKLPFTLADSVWKVMTQAEKKDVAWAEDRLGQEFEPEPVKPDAVVFRSEADILAFARRHDAEFSRWAKRLVPTRRAIETYLDTLAPGVFVKPRPVASRKAARAGRKRVKDPVNTKRE
jgi:hypothetical protein